MPFLNASFVFCPIPKAGCSAWKQVLRRIKGIEAYLADDHWSLHHGTENGLEMDRIHRNGLEAANLILHHDPPIFHGVFVRDSLERSLSAFLEKCVHSEWRQRDWCRPQSDRQRDRYSHFDLFVETVISRAQKPENEFLATHSFWQLDYHWMPMNWICDLYQHIDLYTVYDADDVKERKRFLMDIGGERTWNAVGASGWFHHASSRRNLFSDIYIVPKYEKFESVDSVNNISREHPPQIRGHKEGDVLNISGSLLSENAAHTQSVSASLIF